MQILINFLNNNYLLLKALHVISMISWMAALLYLPRLFVYHTTVKKKTEASEMLKIMEYRLQKYIMNPAMVATIFFGILLLNVKNVINWNEKWIYIKLFLVLGLIIVHHLLIKFRKDFYYDRNTHSKKFYKILNEVPTIFLIFIILIVYLKPF
tara:strand:- start:2433 stop:2891 length:459 start_codon:yes stop_codon:yes gene_type:complete